MPDPTIPVSEYAARRERVLGALEGAIGVLHAGEARGEEPFRPHPHFEYLTGVTDEPGAILLLDPLAPLPARRATIFLRPLDPEAEKWEGYRPTISAELRQRFGFEGIFRLGHFGRFVTIAARRSHALACLQPPAHPEQTPSADLQLFQKIAGRIAETRILDRTELLPRLRSAKSDAEVAMIRRAIEITARGFDAAMQAVRPGAGERDVKAALEDAFRAGGSPGPAFGSITGSGINSTVLHYRGAGATLETGDLICIDAGAAVGGYGADITRTLPVGGRFSDRQREVYQVVLDAHAAAIAAVKPGVHLAEVDAAARAVIAKAGFGDWFIHSVGHHLGLRTHDDAPDEPLPAGAVVTIEPGIYMPHERTGIRIEDDVLVTKGGCEVLSKAIPREVEEIEAAMG